MSESNNNTLGLDNLSDDSPTTREYAPCFILEDKYFEQLRTPNQIALYSFLARNTYREIPVFKTNLDEFCLLMDISLEEAKSIIEYLHAIGFLTKGN